MRECGSTPAQRIGMANLERYFLSKGHNVAGYDRSPSQLTAALQQEGVEITYDDCEDCIPEPFRNPDDTLVVFTPAVPESSRILYEKEVSESGVAGVSIVAGVHFCG